MIRNTLLQSDESAFPPKFLQQLDTPCFGSNNGYIPTKSWPVFLKCLLREFLAEKGQYVVEVEWLCKAKDALIIDVWVQKGNDVKTSDVADVNAVF